MANAMGVAAGRRVRFRDGELDVARRPDAGYAVCVPDAPPESGLRAHGHPDACARHRREHRHVHDREQRAAETPVRTNGRRRWCVPPQHDVPPAGFRGVWFPNYLDLREGTTGLFAELAAFSPLFVGLDAGDGTRRTLASATTANYFRIFNRPLALGRPFTNDEERLGADIRVSDRQPPDLAAARRRCRHHRPVRTGQRRDVHRDRCDGRRLHRNSYPGPEVWLPFGAHETITGSAGPTLGAREQHELGVVGKLRAGVSEGAASPALAIVADRLEQAFPRSTVATRSRYRRLRV